VHTIEPHGGDGDGGPTPKYRLMAATMRIAARLADDAADHLDDADGAQCHARLAEIAANDAFIEKNHAAIAAREQAERDQSVKSPERDQAGQNQSPMHA